MVGSGSATFHDGIRRIRNGLNFGTVLSDAYVHRTQYVCVRANLANLIARVRLPD